MSRKKSNSMRQSDPPKTPKVWEKARREKMKIYFNELQEVLPLYDPSAPMSRFEILQKSRIYIKELQNQNQDLLNGGFDEVYKNKMDKLKQRVKELLQRVDQLTDLLRTANIMIPPLVPCPGKQESFTLSQKWMNQRPKKWTEKISVVVPDEKIENILTLIKDFKKKSNSNSNVNSGSNNNNNNTNINNKNNINKNNNNSNKNNCVLDKDKVEVSVKNNSKVSEEQSDQKRGEQSVQKSIFGERVELKKKKQLKKNKTNNVTESSVSSNAESFTDSHSPSHTKENQPVDFNLPVSDDPAEEARDKKEKDKSEQRLNAGNDSGVKSKPSTSSEKVCLLSGKVKNVIEPQNNVFLPVSTNVMQSNTYILTNDGNLVQFPLLNSSGNVFGANHNLLTQAAIVNQTNSGLLTPLVINRPSPVIVLQKPAPHIIQAAHIVNPTPQILSVPNPNIQILGNSIVCPTSSQNTNTKTLPYILSKQPANKKRITKDSTMTTYVNKIPIPALSKQSYVKKTVSLNTCISAKMKTVAKTKDKEKLTEKSSSAESESEVSVNEKEIQTEKFPESTPEPPVPIQRRESEGVIVENPKRSSEENEDESVAKSKKQKVTDDTNVFKPILPDTPVVNDALFCNLKLPNSMGHNISVSPTAAFLSTFPIVASSKCDVEDDLTSKMEEKRCDDKNDKLSEAKSNSEKFSNQDKQISTQIQEMEAVSSEDCTIVPEVPLNQKESQQQNENNRNEPDKEILLKPSNDMCLVSNNPVKNGKNLTINGAANNLNIDFGAVANNAIENCPQIINKSWNDFQDPKICEVRTDPFYVHSTIPNPALEVSNSMTSFAITTPVYKTSYNNNNNNSNNNNNNNHTSNMKLNFNVQSSVADQSGVKTNQFDYQQKENFMGKRMSYNPERNMTKKPCSNEVYNVPKNQTVMYQTETAPNYQLMPPKDVSGQRHSRPPVNWMTDPDVRSRSLCTQTAKIPPFLQPDIWVNQKSQTELSTDHLLTDINKLNYQKNDFFPSKVVDPQMKPPCKNSEKRLDAKFSTKATQNTYNIFDYNYNGNYFNEEDTNKFCNVQPFPQKTKKNNGMVAKKKPENQIHLVNGDPQGIEAAKRNSDQIIGNLDFNPVANQECFSWVPGKNVEWLPSKSFVDTNLILPSTLPTLVGDLALGTTSSNDVSQVKPNTRLNHGKPVIEATGKSYVDLGLGNNTTTFGKPTEPEKQYLEPFTNLSKNIFDMTNNVPNPQLQKNDCDKSGFVTGNANETIVLKNIFELPVSKNDFVNRNKQRAITNNSQNTFLSVSQLVETPNYESSSIKSESAMDSKQPEFSTNYTNYHGNAKSYKSKGRISHYKYNDRKYQNYKNSSTNYTAEALIRSNPNLPYQSNEFQPEVNSNFYAGKNPQKPENFPANKNDFDPISKTDFVPCSTQNIYADFNFSSPVPNFNIATSVSSDYVGHDSNFSTQNNSFFTDFVPPEYPMTESVSNSLLLPPCSIGLQNPFIIEKRNTTPEKSGKAPGKNFPNSRARKSFDCSKSSYDFSIPHNSGIFTTTSITCPTIFTSTSCQNLLPMPNQSVPDSNISFSASSFTSGNIPFPPPLTSNSNSNYQPPRGSTHNHTSTTFFPSNSMFTTCSTTTVSSSRTCPSSVPSTTSTNAVITTPFSNAPFPASTQSGLPFLSLSNPIITPSVPSTSGNTLANFNLSTIFPEINQKGNYHYP